MVKTHCLIPHLLEPTLPEAIASAVDQFERVSLAYGYQGVQQTRNALLMDSTAEYVSYLDADDYRLPNSVLTQVEMLERTGADCCYSPNQHGAVSADPLLAIITSRMNPSALWRRSALLAIADRFGEAWDTSYSACTDAIVYLRALQCGLTLVYCGQPAIYYRPGGTLTQDKCRWALAKHQLLDEIEAWSGAHKTQIANERAIANEFLTRCPTPPTT